MEGHAKRKRHVLVVDDGPLNRRLATSLLRSLDCRVDIACGGLEAVCMVLMNDYDLVLMDLQMPDMDGATALRKIRAGEAESGPGVRTPIFALSADEPTPDSACFDGHLSKPVSVAMLRAILAGLDSLTSDLAVATSQTEHAFPTLSEVVASLEQSAPDSDSKEEMELRITELADLGWRAPPPRH